MKTTKKRGRPKKINYFSDENKKRAEKLNMSPEMAEANGFGEIPEHIDKVLDPIIKPISVLIKVNGKELRYETGNVLHILRHIDLKPNFLKTFIHLEVEYQGRKFFRLFRIPQMRMLLGNDERRIFLAKLINQTLNIKGENLYV